MKIVIYWEELTFGWGRGGESTGGEFFKTDHAWA